MRLLKVRLQGIGRFEESPALYVADRLVAIVGPNESGKTTLLQALNQIDLTDPLPASMRTRQASTEPRIEALFELADSERQELADIRGGGDVRRAWLIRGHGKPVWRLEPEPSRDLAPRAEALAAVLAIANDPVLDEAHSGPEHPFTPDVWGSAVAALESSSDSLTNDERVAVGQLANALGDLVEDDDGDDPDGDNEAVGEEAVLAAAEERAAVTARLHALGVSEAESAPRATVRERLRGLLPTVVEFTDVERDLQPEYDLNIELDPAREEGVSPALQNLADLAGLELTDLHQAISSGDQGTVRLLREAANSVLEETFDRDYLQSDVCVQLETEGALLRILVRAEGGEDFVPLDQRSAGFQWFAALVGFLASRAYQRPLLVIDEIERHLHYAAQADLVDVLTRQKIAEQVIYTTHSAGALPPDLGTGVRAVVPVPDRQRSQIDNAFWTSGPGFTPLLFGMGAGALAFSIPRYVLLAEGASEAVLLPTLIREATGVGELAYRIAPGISNAAAADLHRLDEEGGRVGYLVDGDAGGIELRDALLDAQIDQSRVIDLLELTGEPMALEDLVNGQVYLEAIAAELEPFAEGLPTDADVPAVGRAAAIAAWCKERGLEAPSKTRVAQRVVSAVLRSAQEDTPAELFAPGAQAWIRTLHERTLQILQVPQDA